ncbi:MAG TPA: peptide-methionine (R)-S-oxide reductase MsrB [Allosphingosinicella sp.]
MTDLSRRALLGTGLAAGIGAIVFARASGPAQAAMTFQVTHSAQDWRRMLGAERYAVLREAHTERPGSSPLLKEHRRGIFACAGCALPLFAASTKFESGTGWPSFWQALPHAVAKRTDSAFGMERTEILCRRCGGHLGHLFDDGPKPTGLRYCMNGLALTFRPA